MSKPLKILKYPNLLAEMKKRGETQDHISELLGLSRTTVNLGLSGKREWTISEIEKLCEHYQKDYYELFKGN
jgi:transcriptional regulator with XRE-family HTH domain